MKKILKRFRIISPQYANPADPWLSVIIPVIILIGIVMVYDASVALALRDFNDPYHFVRDQIRWLGVGCVALFTAYAIDYRSLKKLALPFMAGTGVLLLAVFLPGIGIRALGAHRWLSLGPLVLQPAELAKLALIVYLAAWLSRPDRGKLLYFLSFVSVVGGLVVLEPDLGTATILFCIALGMYFSSGAPLWHFLMISPLVGIGVGGLAVIAPYRLKRITSFLNPDADPLGSSYQIRQALIAIGTGGLSGLGFGKSRQKYEYLPEANTDSIFAIFAEEFGFIGCIALLLLLSAFVIRGFSIARRIDDPFGKLLAAGITTWIGVQSALNIAAITGLVPLTGIPLPFISYGGSSLVITMTAAGILLNVSRHVK